MSPGETQIWQDLKVNRNNKLALWTLEGASSTQVLWRKKNEENNIEVFDMKM
jgi:hypothetical protein